MSVLGDVIAFDPDALAFEDNLDALAFEDDLDDLGDVIASEKEELCTYSSEVLISSYKLIKDEAPPNESELLSEPELLSEMIIMFSAM
ncbi:hypothetical protein Tco_1135326 [Tanacetum coccineum]